MEKERSVKRESVADLRKLAAEYNPRKASKKDLEDLDLSMDEFGSLDGIIVNIESGNVVSGHQRLKVLDPKSKVYKEKYIDKNGTCFIGHIETPEGMRIPYREVKWDSMKEKAANLAANNSAGEWDYPALTNVLEYLDNGQFDMSFTGFDNEELERIFSWTPEDERKLNESFSDEYGEEKQEREPDNQKKELSDVNLNQVKVNLTSDQVNYLDAQMDCMGLSSRSQVLRMILEEHMEDQIA